MSKIIHVYVTQRTVVLKDSKGAVIRFNAKKFAAFTRGKLPKVGQSIQTYYPVLLR